ncbi:MAG: 3-mercaptopyruvate sulfurtransferase [Pseudomonadota bacterium]|nr:3-mercaptopyruvate sulfurtransferase [Pseudomonadota bacterium]
MDPLVSTDWLAAHLEDSDLALLDATWFMPGTPRDAAAEFAERHIAGAVFFDIDKIADSASALPHMLADPADFAVAARRLGVNPESTVVIYDALGLFSAPRGWWNFRAMSHARATVLDGGLPKWLAEGRPVESGWREPVHGAFKARARADLVRDLEGVRAALAAGSEQLLDARPADRFTGQAPEPRPGLRSGHMPSARNLPWSSLVRSDGTLLPAEALRAAFEGAGVDLTSPIVTSCGSGISASLLALALARLGRDDVAVYDGSWSEWGGRSDTPVVLGSA